jgi:hypothetical protein
MHALALWGTCVGRSGGLILECGQRVDGLLSVQPIRCCGAVSHSLCLAGHGVWTVIGTFSDKFLIDPR